MMPTPQTIVQAIAIGGLLFASALGGSRTTASMQGAEAPRADTTDVAIPFPAEYRTWAHVKSVLVGPESPAFRTEGGIHHIYANELARQGYRTGRFPDGSVIVYDLLETKEVNGNTIEGAPRRLDVMAKDSRRFRDTEGWAFASFGKGDRTNGQLSADRQRTCLECHAKSKARDFVHSQLRP